MEKVRTLGQMEVFIREMCWMAKGMAQVNSYLLVDKYMKENGNQV